MRRVDWLTGCRCANRQSSPTASTVAPNILPVEEVNSVPVEMEDERNDVKVLEQSSALRSLIAGAGAGVICTLLCAPLDVTKVRLQVQGSLGETGRRNKYTGGVFSSIKRIYVEEGLRGVFKGVGPALVTVPLFWGVYWPIYDNMKAYFEREDSPVSLRTGHILSAIIAGATGDVITNPFWVTRTRIQTLAMHSEVKLSSEVSTIQMMKFIYETEGWTAFYKGLGASFLGLSHVGIQFPLYEYLKLQARGGENRKETFFELLFASTSAKLVASSITYPHEVIRARLQDGRTIKAPFPHANNGGSNNFGAGIATPTANVVTHNSAVGAKSHTPQRSPYSTSTPSNAASHRTPATATSVTPSSATVQSCDRQGIISVVRSIVEKEGVTALWSGIRVNMFRVVPATASTFLAYEYITRYLKENCHGV